MLNYKMLLHDANRGAWSAWNECSYDYCIYLLCRNNKFTPMLYSAIILWTSLRIRETQTLNKKTMKQLTPQTISWSPWERIMSRLLGLACQTCLNPCRLYLHGILNDELYTNNPGTEVDLLQNMQNIVFSFSLAELRHAKINTLFLCDSYLRADGNHDPSIYINTVKQVLVLTAMTRTKTRGPHSRQSRIATIAVVPNLTNVLSVERWRQKLVTVLRAHVLKIPEKVYWKGSAVPMFNMVQRHEGMREVNRAELSLLHIDQIISKERAPRPGWFSTTAWTLTRNCKPLSPPGIEPLLFRRIFTHSYLIRKVK
jgi:hypothetical protein